MLGSIFHWWKKIEQAIVRHRSFTAVLTPRATILMLELARHHHQNTTVKGKLTLVKTATVLDMHWIRGLNGKIDLSVSRILPTQSP